MHDFRDKRRFRRFVGFLFAIVGLFALVAPAFCASQDLGYEVARPQDEGKPYLTVFGDVPFDVAELKALHPEAHFRHVRENDPIADRYRATVGTFPAIVYQRPTGEVIFKASGKNLPRSAQEVMVAVGNCRPFRRPSPEPTPAPVPPPAPVFVPSAPVPDTAPIPDTEPAAPVWVYLAAFGVAFGVTLAVKVVQEVRQ